jgi:hypothetical protein
MRQLTWDRDVDATPTSQARRLRQEISRYQRRLLELDHPETVRNTLESAQAQLDQIEERAKSF